MIRVEKEINLTPSELAEEIWNKDDDEQANLLNALGYLVRNSQGERHNADALSDL